jgi:hypothetical protein
VYDEVNLNGISFSNDGSLNRSIFYSQFNDVNIYVEDKDKEYVYETIFSRLFANQSINIAAIITTGGKNSLTKAFNKFGEKSDEGKSNVYIADGDFDKILQKPMIDNSHFIYLNKYNIECYWIDKNAIIEYMKCKCKCKKKETEEIINFAEGYNKIILDLCELFVLFMIVQNERPSLKNVDMGVYKFIDNDTGYILPEKIAEYKAYLRPYFPELDKKISQYKLIADTYTFKDYSIIICGKYLLRCLYHYIKSKVICGINYEDLQNFLICLFDIRSLDYVKSRILGVA